MRHLLLPLCATIAMLFASDALAATTLVAGVSITTPAESLLAREPDHAPDVSPNASPSRGTALSVVATVVPVVAGVALIGADVERNVLGASLIGGGIVVGPAVGYVDAGLVGRGITGIGWRAGVAVLGFAAAVGEFDRHHVNDENGGPLLILFGASILTTGLAVYDCVAVHGDIAKAQRATISFGPANVAGAPGVGVSVRF